MVRRLVIIFATIFLLSSCGFFGASVFPLATSIDVGWFTRNGSMRHFYILDNGIDEPLLILTNEESGKLRVLIFDTSLNLRGYMENGSNGVLTDGLGFVDHAGNFIIGQTKITNQGTTDPGDIEQVFVPNGFWGAPDPNALIFRWEDPLIADPFYIRVDNSARLYGYDPVDPSWNLIFGTDLGIPFERFMPNGLNFAIPQSNPDLADFYFADMSGNLYNYTKDELFQHASGLSLLPDDFIPDLSINNPNLTQWVTRCSKGFFVSETGMDNGAYVLIDEQGGEIGRIDDGQYVGEVVTIDYNCDYYYVVDWKKNVIRKERVPF